MQHISDMHSKLALRPHHVWKYGRSNLQRLRIGKERKKEEEETTAAKYNVHICYTGQP